MMMMTKKMQIHQNKKFFTSKTRRTSALVRIDFVLTSSVVQAGIGETFVEIMITMITAETGTAKAVVTSFDILADSVMTKIIIKSAFINVFVAVEAGPKLSALAFVTILKKRKSE